MSHVLVKECHPDQGLQPAWRDLLFALQPATLREQQVLRLRARPDSSAAADESAKHGGRCAQDDTVQKFGAEMNNPAYRVVARSPGFLLPARR